MLNLKNIVGRAEDIKVLNDVYESKKAHLVAVYGRRRVGKTYLVRSFFKNRKNYLEVTGLKNGSLDEQLHIFTKALSALFYPGAVLAQPKSWQEAFTLLDNEIKKIKHKIVIFFDELPWLATPKSGLLQQLDHFWNTQWSDNKNVKIILCGSAASWMIDNLINAKGGLHNRLTERLLIQPFTLNETELYFKYLGVQLSRKQILELYMCLGGIPYYLNAIKRGESASQAIQRLCFQKKGLLFDEFERLFASLFDSSVDHISIVKELSKVRCGLSRSALLKNTRLPSGGSFAKKLKELEDAGFISHFVPYGKVLKDALYKLTDEFSLFHLSWIEKAPRDIFSLRKSNYWKKMNVTPSYRSWCGYTFESVCLKHYPQLLKALHLDDVGVRVGSWSFKSKTSVKEGLQIDLLFDRDDGVITLCELKYYASAFSIDKSYATLLEKRIELFRAHFKIRKDIFLCLVTPLPAKQNVYYGRLIQHEVNLDALFAA